MISKKMLMLYAFTIYGGLVVTYFCGVVPILIKDKLMAAGFTDKVYINRQTAIVMIFFGLSNALGGYLFGELTLRLGKKFGMFLIFISGAAACLTTFFIQYYVLLA